MPPPLYLGKVETLTIGNRGSICYIAYSPDYSAVVYYLNCANIQARVLSDYWASYTFALGFFVRLSGAAGGSRGGVADTRLGVEAAIGAPGLRSVGRRGRLAAGTS